MRGTSWFLHLCECVCLHLPNDNIRISLPIFTKFGPSDLAGIGWTCSISVKVINQPLVLCACAVKSMLNYMEMKLVMYNNRIGQTFITFINSGIQGGSCLFQFFEIYRNLNNLLCQILTEFIGDSDSHWHRLDTGCWDIAFFKIQLGCRWNFKTFHPIFTKFVQ